MADTSVIQPVGREDTRETESRPAVTLDSWSRHDWSDGLQIDRLAPLETIEARTRNSVYELVVLDGRNGDVLVTGGQFFPTSTRVRLNGCTAGGSCLKWRGVYCGFRLEFQVGTEVVVTTRVQSVVRVEKSSAPAHVH
ncbi:MAG TPA: hypothetical protein VJN96_24090 [Vicinamibacterales bacterium]|nr:hypothetical protein [Vicinamibacterales bacterium]